MYLLDANVFIQAKNLHYRFATFPCFWDWLNEHNASGHLASTTLIQKELASGNDELAQWANAAQATWFISEHDRDTQRAFRDIAAWVSSHPRYKGHAKQTFLAAGDPWLIAKAITLHATVVTHEKSAPESVKKIFIPDVCQYFEVPHLDTYDLLERMNACFAS